METLTLNLSMLGKQNTGLGVYAINCKNELEKRFFCKTISSVDADKNTIPSPKSIRINGSQYASLKRLLYSTLLYPKNIGFVYTPTHHGFIGYEKQVITIHDLICMHYPNQHKNQYLYFKYIVPLVLKKCKGVFTVSYTTKKEICRYYHLSEDFVHVIPNAILNSVSREKTPEQEKKRRYLLVVGAGYQHKNIHELIKRHKYWKEKYLLKIVSENGEYGRYLKNLVYKEKLEGKVEFIGFVDRKKLEILYQYCDALVYPSLWEGFGIPPLEAISYRKPVILSDIPVFHEIFQEAAIYVKPSDNESWMQAFSFLENQKEIENKMKKGENVLKKYSWKENGEKIRDILISIEPGLKDVLKHEDK